MSANGFGMNQGVARGAGRENPSPVDLDFNPVGVSENVPIVMPTEPDRVDADMGAVQLARTLGNIDFGALSRQFQAGQEARRKAKAAAEEAEGHATVAQLLSATGMDLAALERAGRIPASATPNFKLGASIAAAQHTFAQLRTAVLKRGIDNPNAGNFLEDAEFMAQFQGKLGGVRNEAIVQYFLNPAQELARDDSVRQAKAFDTQAKQKMLTDTLGTWESAIKVGDPIEPALNNTFNTLKLSNQLNDENARTIIEAAGPQIVQAAMTPDGKVDMAVAGKLLMELGNAKIIVEGGRMLKGRHLDAFKSVTQYVTSTVADASNAAIAQEQAHQRDASGQWVDWLIESSQRNPDGTFTLPTVQDSVKKAIELGYDPDDMLKLYKEWDSTGGNVSAADDAKTNFEAATLATLIKMTPAQRSRYEASLPVLHESGEISNNELLVIKKVLNTLRQQDPKSPFRSEDMKAMRDSIEQQLPQVFSAAGGNMDSHLLGATGRFNIPGSQYGTLRGIVSDKVSSLAMDWAVTNGGTDYQAYVSSLDMIDSQPGEPTRLMRQITNRFLQENGPALGDLIMKALASPNPGAALDSMSLTPKKREPVPYVEPSMRKPAKAAPKSQQASPKPAASTPSPAAEIKKLSKAQLNIMNTSTPIYKWYAATVRKQNPRHTDAQIIKRLQSMLPRDIRNLQILFEQGGGQ